MNKTNKGLVVIIIVIVLLFGVSSGFALNYHNKYKTTQGKYTNLQDDYDELEANYNTLDYQYDNLENNYNTLQSNYNSLQSNYNTLQSNYNNLQSNYEGLSDSYTSYQESIELRYGNGEDCKQFITPSDNSVQNSMKQALSYSNDGSLSWEDIQDINEWVRDHVIYNHDTFIGDVRNCYFYPSETIEFGYGDCEDQAVLMASMCLAEENVNWLFCAHVSYINNEGERVGHLFVIINVADDKMHIFDPTHSKQYSNPLEKWYYGEQPWRSDSSISEPEAFTEYEDDFGYSSLEIHKIFNSYTYKTFSSNQEFYDYF